MFRRVGLLTVLIVLALGQVVLAQGGLNPAGFLDPRGSAYMGTANPPNAPLAPTGSSSSLPLIGGSTLPPGVPSYYYNNSTYRNEIESNPALRQEVRRPFGGGGYRGGSRTAVPPKEGSQDEDDEAQAVPQDPAKSMNFSERQNTGHAVGFRDSAYGRATGKLANDWRYVYFQRRHWYWMPNNSWAVWERNRWIPHAQFVREQEATLGPTPQVQVRSYRGYNSGMYGQMQVTALRASRAAGDRPERSIYRTGTDRPVRF